MPVAFSEAIYFIFDGRTIPGPETFNSAGKHGRFFEPFFKCFMHRSIGVGDPATPLLGGDRYIGKREPSRLRVSPLFLHPCVIEAPAIDAGRGSGFHAS